MIYELDFIKEQKFQGEQLSNLISFITNMLPQFKNLITLLIPNDFVLF